MFGKTTLVTGSLALLGAAALPALGQTDTLFITNPAAGTLHRLQGGAMAMSGQQTGLESPIAIIKDVRTLGAPASGGGGMGSTAYTYDLFGAPTGSYTHATTLAPLYDGATDGKHFYSVNPSTKRVYRFDSQWADAGKGGGGGGGSSGDSLFALPNGGWGITWDNVDKAFWISVPSKGTIEEYSIKGALLKSIPYGWGKTALAWEPSTDSLWAVDNYGGGSARQIFKDGSFGATVPLGFTMMAAGGAEFAIPAPGAAVLAGLGMLAAARRRR